jgi:hypothetical protein
MDQWPSSEAGFLNGEYQQLIRGGLDPSEAKAVVLARLYATTTLQAGTSSGIAYWKPAFKILAVAEARRRIEADEDIRKRLVEIFGPDAAADAAFREIFLPLGARFDFLGSAEQLQLQQYQLDYEQSAADRKEDASGSSGQQPMTISAQSRGSASGALFGDLSRRLGRTPALEYMYRFSPLADEVRQADVVRSEAEYRQVFEQLIEFESAPTAEKYAATRGALRQLLGSQRFGRLWAARDPFFVAMRKIGRDRSLLDDSILAAYEVINDVQDRFAAIAVRGAEEDPERLAADFRVAQADMERRLIGLVGDDTARALLAAQAHFALSTQSVPSDN